MQFMILEYIKAYLYLLTFRIKKFFFPDPVIEIEEVVANSVMWHRVYDDGDEFMHGTLSTSDGELAITLSLAQTRLQLLDGAYPLMKDETGYFLEARDGPYIGYHRFVHSKSTAKFQEESNVGTVLRLHYSKPVVYTPAGARTLDELFDDAPPEVVIIHTTQKEY